MSKTLTRNNIKENRESGRKGRDKKGYTLSSVIWTDRPVISLTVSFVVSWAGTKLWPDDTVI